MNIKYVFKKWMRMNTEKKKNFTNQNLRCSVMREENSFNAFVRQIKRIFHFNLSIDFNHKRSKNQLSAHLFIVQIQNDELFKDLEMFQLASYKKWNGSLLSLLAKLSIHFKRRIIFDQSNYLFLYLFRWFTLQYLFKQSFYFQF